MMIRLIFSLCAVFLLSQTARADLLLGPIHDFEDGTLQGWAPIALNTANIPNGGPTGAGDNFLEISSGAGAGPGPGRLAAFSQDANVTGQIDPGVTEIQVDIMRPATEFDLGIRLVLFGPTGGDRWTSTDAQTVVGDGSWNTYTFSILEADLTQVLGTDTYANMSSDLNRIMFRHQSGAPDSQGEIVGTTGAGTFGIDNVIAGPLTAIPEPTSFVMVALGLLGLLHRRRHA